MQRTQDMPRRSSAHGHAPASAGRVHRTRTALAFVALLVLVLSAGIVDPGLALAFAPALALLALLTVGVRPGERLIERLRARSAPATHQRAASEPRPRLPLLVRPVGRSFATALAMRPPPVALAHQR